jgi:hypothetical protein
MIWVPAFAGMSGLKTGRKLLQDLITRGFVKAVSHLRVGSS